MNRLFLEKSPYPLASLPLSAGTDASQGSIEMLGIQGACAALKTERQDPWWLLASSTAGGKEEPQRTQTKQKEPKR